MVWWRQQRHRRQRPSSRLRRQQQRREQPSFPLGDGVPSTLILHHHHHHHAADALGEQINPGSERSPHPDYGSIMGMVPQNLPPVRLLTGTVLVEEINTSGDDEPKAAVYAVLGDEHRNSNQDEEEVLDLGEACPICLIEYEHGEEIRCPAACHHAYHTHCLAQWLENSGSRKECPCCRQPLMDNDDTRNTTSTNRRRRRRRRRQEPPGQRFPEYAEAFPHWMAAVISLEEDEMSDAAVMTTMDRQLTRDVYSSSPERQRRRYEEEDELLRMVYQLQHGQLIQNVRNGGHINTTTTSVLPDNNSRNNEYGGEQSDDDTVVTMSEPPRSPSPLLEQHLNNNNESSPPRFRLPEEPLHDTPRSHDDYGYNEDQSDNAIASSSSSSQRVLPARLSPTTEASEIPIQESAGIDQEPLSSTRNCSSSSLRDRLRPLLDTAEGAPPVYAQIKVGHQLYSCDNQCVLCSQGFAALHQPNIHGGSTRPAPQRYCFSQDFECMHLCHEDCLLEYSCQYLMAQDSQEQQHLDGNMAGICMVPCASCKRPFLCVPEALLHPDSTAAAF